MDIHKRILRAWVKGTGLRLSPDDVEDLCQDDAVVTAVLSAVDPPAADGSHNGSQFWHAQEVWSRVSKKV